MTYSFVHAIRWTCAHDCVPVHIQPLSTFSCTAHGYGCREHHCSGALKGQ